MDRKKKAAKQPGSQRRWMIPAGLLLLIITPFLIVFSIEKKCGAAWEEFLTKWQSSGEKFALQHHLPTPVPDSENLALHPALVPFLETQDPTIDWRQALPGDLPGWSENAYLRYLADLSEGKATNIFPSLGLLPCSPAEFRNHLGRPYREWSAQLDHYEQAIRERAYLAYELDWSRLFIDHELPDLSAYSNLGKAFLARAAIRRGLREARGSLEDLSTTMRLARCYDRLPLLLSHVLQTGLLTSLLDELRAGLEERFFDQSHLEQISALLESAPSLPANYLAGLRFERALMLEFFNVVESSDNADLLPSLSSNKQSGVIRHALNRRWMNASRLALCEDQQELFLGPGPKLANVDHWHSALDLRLTDSWERFVAPLGHETLISVQMGTALAKTVIIADATLQRTHLAVALSRYRADRGRFPDQLKDLLPDYLPSLPEFDPSIDLDYQIMPRGRWCLSLQVPGAAPDDWEGGW